MPRENRKRGKKNKKASEEDTRAQPTAIEDQGGPSWIKPPTEQETNTEAPFGYVDTDVKAYFRTVDIQIRDWAENEAMDEEFDTDRDPNEERRMFFVAALREMSGKEKPLATDPDCSTILERMSYSMDDFVRRVFLDALSGSHEELFRHRFASHVCQTIFTVAADTIARESRGIFPPLPEDQDEKGELRTMTQLILDVCEEIQPSLSSLIMDPFASHVLRALIMLLSPSIMPSVNGPSQVLRSKKSASWKARQGQMKSVFNDESQLSGKAKYRAPTSFTEAAKKFALMIRQKLGPNEVRALAADKVASPVLQLLLEVEAEHGLANDSDSLMDRVLVGLITSIREDPDHVPEASDYLGTLLRDPTSSHLLETLVSRCPRPVFSALYQTYFQGHLGRLASHPIANFIVAKVLARADMNILGNALEELRTRLDKLLQTGKVGVVRALVERAASLKALEREVVAAIYEAQGLDATSPEGRALFVPCTLRLLTKEAYESALSSKLQRKPDDGASRKGSKHEATTDPLEPKIQGSLLLQSILYMNELYNKAVTDSIMMLSLDDLIALCHDATGSRVVDAMLESSTVPKQVKRKFIMSFIGNFHLLVDDRIGSRVGDRLWASADPYLKEKIGRSLFAHEQYLASSRYGSFFARGLNLHQLRRNPEEWKTQQQLRASAKTNSANWKSAEAVTKVKPTTLDLPEPRKRKAEDDIEVMFDDAGLSGKKKKHVALSTSEGAKTEAKADSLPIQGDKVLKDVLSAIKRAPKNEHRKHKKGERTQA